MYVVIQVLILIVHHQALFKKSHGTLLLSFFQIGELQSRCLPQLELDYLNQHVYEPRILMAWTSMNLTIVELLQRNLV